VSAGANVLALQRMNGHRGAKQTLDVYADLFDTDLDDVASNLHTAYAPRDVGKRGHTATRRALRLLLRSALICQIARQRRR
jgi:hypothetical protein